MKIRTDFVTNSSSVSYILTMHPELVDVFVEAWQMFYGKLNLQVAEYLRELILREGTRCMLEGEMIYTKRIKFSTDETLLEDDIGVSEKKPDLSRIDDDKLWRFVCGEYLLNGRVGQLRGFGATQVETY